MVQPMQTTFAAKVFDRERLGQICDWLAVALAVSLPWSTSATGILAALWLVILIPTLDFQSMRRALATPAGGLPVLLWVLGAIGMLWADVPLAERIDGLNSFHKLLVIPLMLVHFRRSERGPWVMGGFLLSCGVLLAVSWALRLFPSLIAVNSYSPGVPVKDYIAQNAMFIVSIAIVIDLAFDAWRKARRGIALAWVVVAFAFLANILFVATSRTSLIVIPFLLLLFGFKRFGWKGLAGLLAVVIIVMAVAWPFATQLQGRVSLIMQEVNDFRAECKRTSAGERLTFWKKSFEIVAKAPVIGHGTGTIREQFRRSASADDCESMTSSANPHNQTFAVAIQLGLVGTIALYLMWIAHLSLFRGESLAAWVGMAIVVQNMVSSLFNSHLFDFTHGWGYVVGVGVAGGIMLRNAPQRTREAKPPNEEKPG